MKANDGLDCTNFRGTVSLAQPRNYANLILKLADYCMFFQVDRFTPGLRNHDLHAWDAFPEKENRKKASLDFRNLF